MNIRKAFITRSSRLFIIFLLLISSISSCHSRRYSRHNYQNRYKYSTQSSRSRVAQMSNPSKSTNQITQPKVRYSQKLATKKVLILTINNIDVYDGEEDDYLLSTGGDEILLAFNVIILDNRLNIISTSSDCFYREGVQKGMRYIVNQTIEVPIDYYNNAGIFITLLEVDNNSRAREFLSQTKHALGVVRTSASLLGATASDLSGLRMLSRTLGYAGIALSLVDFLDEDDLLGEKMEFYQTKEIQFGINRSDALLAVGNHNYDEYRFVVNYSVRTENRSYWISVRD